MTLLLYFLDASVNPDNDLKNDAQAYGKKNF